jgi:hypothetical protein
MGLVQSTTQSSVTRRGAGKFVPVLKMKTCGRSGHVVLLFLSLILDRAGWKTSRYGLTNPGERATFTHRITTEMNKMKL